MLDLPPDPPAIIGRASVIDGDTLDIHGHRVRLWGVDAPETGQSCERGGRSYRCGQVAANTLGQWIGQRPVSCDPVEIDRYSRTVARCSVSGEDIGRWLVRSGWAVEYTAYSDGRYGSDERAAIEARSGLHAGTFDAPWGWRRAERAQSRPVEGPPGDCAIKGNINRDGERIYHVPDARSYPETRIDTGAGERWFCSTAEAEAAGWRSPR